MFLLNLSPSGLSSSSLLSSSSPLLLFLFQYLEQQHQLSPGDTAFFINGVRMDGDMFEVFSVLERIDAESDLIEGLSALGSRLAHYNILINGSRLVGVCGSVKVSFYDRPIRTEYFFESTLLLIFPMLYFDIPRPFFSFCRSRPSIYI